jgi:hypothetical protein
MHWCRKDGGVSGDKNQSTKCSPGGKAPRVLCVPGPNFAKTSAGGQHAARGGRERRAREPVRASERANIQTVIIRQRAACERRSADVPRAGERQSARRRARASDRARGGEHGRAPTNGNSERGYRRPTGGGRPRERRLRRGVAVERRTGIERACRSALLLRGVDA